jgi:type IV pilus assembly protein PilA
MTQEVMMFTTLLQRLNERRAAEFEAEGSAESGFTLIELMVVLLILAILLAIAIPTFLGVTGSANDRSAQSNLNTALTNAKTIYEQSNQLYPTTALSLAINIASNEPSLPMNTTLATNAGLAVGTVSAVTSADSNGAVVFSLANKTNECWWIADNTNAIVTGTNNAWGVLTATPATTTIVGAPTSVGIWYGVYAINKANGGSLQANCGPVGLSLATSNVSNTAFPKAV